MAGRDRADRLRGVFDRIDHVGVAVQEIDASLELYRDLFELDVAHREIVQEQGVEAVLLDVGENHVELLAPLRPRHARRQVPRQARPRPAPRRLSGVRHRRDARRAQAGRAALIDERPRVGIRDSRVAFLHPSAAGGVLTEIVQPAEAH